MAAKLCGFISRAERADKGPVDNALVAKIGTPDYWRARAQYGGELTLQRAVGSLGIGFRLLRRHLDEIVAAIATGHRRGGRSRIDGSHPRRRLGGGRCPALRRQ